MRRAVNAICRQISPPLTASIARCSAAGRATPELLATLAELRAIARDHLAKAMPEIAAMPVSLKPAFLPVALVAPSLDRMDRPGYDPFSGSPDLAPWRRQWIIWRASRRW